MGAVYPLDVKLNKQNRRIDHRSQDQNCRKIEYVSCSPEYTSKDSVLANGTGQQQEISMAL